MIIDLSGVPGSTTLIVERIMHEVAKRGARTIVSGIHKHPRGRLEQLGVAQEVQHEDWVITRAETVRRASVHSGDRMAALRALSGS